ncbi:ABC transporter ATP-binding protein [Ancylobacter sp. Lp-2]|uniref:ABC transporter ATP-binding protein n=1 Tax=Ancylobacter sp. Lp-2 TaxID=2881339 RepID=UPI001E2959C8|nr:ABC transporter ATP-binding protein [Ancylobacter sp. Lp-2]MCB4767034.1 ABC transporter ATP-binding protein [Ancylobacter sp. Lp-2]
MNYTFDIEQPLLMRGDGNSSELTAQHLTVRFQGLAAISDVSLTLHRHEVLGLIGPNGAGKTTLVNCLTGFQRPTEGHVLVGRERTSDWSPVDFRARGVARTFQAGRLFKDMSILENVEAGALALGLGRRQAVEHARELLDWVGLKADPYQKAGMLAYTDQRRLSIARAMVLSPAFVLLDEPAAGMSDAECEDLMELISSIPSLFTCGVLLIEHNMRVVMGISHQIHVLDGGCILAKGTPGEIQNNEAVMAAYLGMES